MFLFCCLVCVWFVIFLVCRSLTLRLVSLFSCSVGLVVRHCWFLVGCLLSLVCICLFGVKPSCLFARCHGFWAWPMSCSMDSSAIYSVSFGFVWFLFGSLLLYFFLLSCSRFVCFVSCLVCFLYVSLFLVVCIFFLLFCLFLSCFSFVPSFLFPCPV